MKKKEWLLVVVFTALWILYIYWFQGTAHAATLTRPIPVEQFDPVTHVWTARAMVAESGWTSANDQIAVVYVFSRRWKAMRKRWPDLRFRDVVFRYSAGIGAKRREYTPRQIWIRSLAPSMERPAGWPIGKASWERHRPLWARTLDRARLWSQGRLRDPCRGKASYFGGDMDEPTINLVEIECLGVRNKFYRVR